MRAVTTRKIPLAIALVTGLLVGMVPAIGVGQAQAAVGTYPCASQSSAAANLDGTFFDDLIVGSPGDHLGQDEIDLVGASSFPKAGSINIVYSGMTGLSSATAAGTAAYPRVLSLDSLGVAGDAEPGDMFGATVATGDFNGDGHPDAIVGAPGKSDEAGALSVFYNRHDDKGTPTAADDTNGIDVAGSQFYMQGRGGVPGTAESTDFFAQAVAVGDFNGDGVKDAAIGIPGESLNTSSGNLIDAGLVQVIYGKSAAQGSNPGLNTGGTSGVRPSVQSIDQSGFGDGVEAGNQFGAALAAGDFNADGFADLAVGIPGDDIGTQANAGSIAIVYGAPGEKGLQGKGHGKTKHTHGGGGTSTSHIFFTQNSPGILGGSEAGDNFGCGLAAFDFDGDGDYDVAIGVPLEDLSQSPVDAGVVQIIYSGGSVGLSGTDPDPSGALACPPSCWTPSQMWTENSGGVKGIAKNQDRFGTSMAAGFGTISGGPAVPYLAIGLPNESLFGLTAVGSVRVIKGSGNLGLTDQAGLAYAQWPDAISSVDYNGVGWITEENDNFGSSLVAASFTGGGDDLAIGVKGEDVEELHTEEGLLPQDPSDPANVTDQGIVQLVYEMGPAASETYDVLMRAPDPSWTTMAGFHTVVPRVAGDSDTSADAFGSAMS